MNYNPQPKIEFQKDPKNIDAHHVVVVDPAVRRGIEVALAQMTRQIVDSIDPQLAGAGHFRVLGAHDLVATFYSLAETPQIATAKDPNNLPGNVRTLTQPKKN
jgi:hypothetical protein